MMIIITIITTTIMMNIHMITTTMTMITTTCMGRVRNFPASSAFYTSTPSPVQRVTCFLEPWWISGWISINSRSPLEN